MQTVLIILCLVLAAVVLCLFVRWALKKYLEGKIMWVELVAEMEEWSEGPYESGAGGTMWTHPKEVVRTWVIAGSEAERLFRDRYTYCSDLDERSGVKGWVFERRSKWLNPGEKPS